MKEESRQALLVLGMHRSGTSAVAGASALLGARLPTHSLAAAPDNPVGFFEAYTAVAVNDWVLKTAGSAWYDCLRFSPDQLGQQDHHTATALMLFSIMQEFPDGTLLLMKDPRLCLTLEMWLPALHAWRVSPAAFLVLRHPAEVIASLTQRDGCPAMVWGALWLHYMLTAEYMTRGHPRAMLAYDAMLHDWRGCLLHAGSRAGIDWPLPPDEVAPQMQRFLDHGLRHFRSTERPARLGILGNLIDQAYEAFLDLIAADDDGPLLHRLDDIRTKFALWHQGRDQNFWGPMMRHMPRAHPHLDLPPEWEGLARKTASTAMAQTTTV